MPMSYVFRDRNFKLVAQTQFLLEGAVYHQYLLIIWTELLFKPIANSRPSIDQQALILRLVRK
jgi:hypothetical protein